MEMVQHRDIVAVED